MRGELNGPWGRGVELRTTGTCAGSSQQNIDSVVLASQQPRLVANPPPFPRSLVVCKNVCFTDVALASRRPGLPWHADRHGTLSPNLVLDCRAEGGGPHNVLQPPRRITPQRQCSIDIVGCLASAILLPSVSKNSEIRVTGW